MPAGSQYPRYILIAVFTHAKRTVQVAIHISNLFEYYMEGYIYNASKSINGHQSKSREDFTVVSCGSRLPLCTCASEPSFSYLLPSNLLEFLR